MEDIRELKALISAPKEIAIITHRNPDGDAIGSSLGLYHYLTGMGHVVKMISPSDYPDFLGWMPEVDRMIIFDNEPEETKAALEIAQIIFCLDFNSLDRIDKIGEMVLKRKVPKVMIDHHLDPEGFSDLMFSFPDYSSTCELLFDVIVELGDRDAINIDIAECIYTGILTDTGSFKYGTSARLFHTVSELVKIGVDNYKLQDLIFNCLSTKHLALLGHCLANRMEILEEYKTGIITLTKKDYADFDIQRGDTEGIVNYLLKIKNVKMAAFITEQPTIVKLSLRSKGDFSVQEIARKHFRGGGHKNASGGASFLNLKATVRKFKELLPAYQEALIH